MNKNIIYFILVIFISVFGILNYIDSTSNYECQQENTVIEKTFSRVTCTWDHVSSDGEKITNRYSTSSGLPLTLILLFLVSVVVYSKNILSGNFYRRFFQKNAKKESTFIALSLFLYLFVLLTLHSSMGFRFGYSDFSIELFLFVFVLSLMGSVPIGFAIFYGKSLFNSSKQNKVFSRMPMVGFVASLLISIIIQGLFFILGSSRYLSGEEGMIIIFWPFYAVFYIIGISIFCLLIGIYLLKYPKIENKYKMKLFIFTLALIPYIVVGMGILF